MLKNLTILMAAVIVSIPTWAQSGGKYNPDFDYKYNYNPGIEAQGITGTEKPGKKSTYRISEEKNTTSSQIRSSANPYHRTIATGLTF